MSASARIRGTIASPIVRLSSLLRQHPSTLSLAQGIVHWQPPFAHQTTARLDGDEDGEHAYGPVFGWPPLVDALERKLQERLLPIKPRICVTAGANAAFFALTLALADAGDQVLLFSPYYFNHLMAVQMTSLQPVILPRRAPAFRIDLDAVERQLVRSGKIKLVVVSNPCNPCGITHPVSDMRDMASLCARHGATLAVDCTYEDFASPGSVSSLLGSSSKGVVEIRSFSKAFGMMGWRLGYLAWTDAALDAELSKVQDTVHICATQASQRRGLAALNAGPEWVASRVASLHESRAVVLDALRRAAGADAVHGGDGAIYALVSMAKHGGQANDDWRTCERLVSEFGVAVVPGSAFGAPGLLRVCYANLSLDKTCEAAARLERGLRAVA